MRPTAIPRVGSLPQILALFDSSADSTQTAWIVKTSGMTFTSLWGGIFNLVEDTIAGFVVVIIWISFTQKCWTSIYNSVLIRSEIKRQAFLFSFFLHNKNEGGWVRFKFDNSLDITDHWNSIFLSPGKFFPVSVSENLPKYTIQPKFLAYTSYQCYSVFLCLTVSFTLLPDINETKHSGSSQLQVLLGDNNILNHLQTWRIWTTIVLCHR